MGKRVLRLRFATLRTNGAIVQSFPRLSCFASSGPPVAGTTRGSRADPYFMKKSSEAVV